MYIILTAIKCQMLFSKAFIYEKIGDFPCSILGAQITPPPLFLIFRILAPAGPYLNLLPNPAGKT